MKKSPSHPPSHRNPLIRLSLAGIATLLLAACGGNTEVSEQKTGAHDAHNHAEHEGAATFAEGRGVALSDTGRQSIGLQTAEVETVELSPSNTQTVQVYRDASEKPTATAKGRTRPGYAYASLLLTAEEARNLKTGQSVQLLGEASAKPARLVGVDWQLEPVTGQAEALVEIPDRDQRWKVGQFVETNFTAHEAQGEEVAAIPENAVLTTAKGDFAFVQNGEHYLRTPIEIAGRQDGRALIADGLYEGDVVASAGVQHLYLIELQAINAGQGCAHGH